MKEHCTVAWLALWGTMFVLSMAFGWRDLLCSKGLAVINGQYYRWFTGLLLHENLFHLLINSVVLYYIGVFYQGQVGPVKLFVFSAAVAVATNGVFAAMYPKSQSVGGSPVVFALIGLILAMELLQKGGHRFSFDTAYGKWIVGFAVFGNIPVFSGNISTLVIHGLSFVLAVAAGAAAIKLGVI